MTPLSLVALLGLGSSFYVAPPANAQTASQADITEINLSLNRQPGESYDALVRRAETAAREAAQRSFTQNSSVEAVAVTVLGQNEGSIAPVLSLDVNRQNWSSNSSPQRWATYFKNSRALLRLDDTGTSTAAQPATQSPSGTPVQVLPNGTVIVPGNVPVQVVPNGTVGAPGTVPGQQVLPNGTVGAPGTVPGQQVLPNGTVAPAGTVPGQQVLPSGTLGTPNTLPGQQGTGNIITPTNNSGNNTNQTNFNTTPGSTEIQNQSGQDLGGNNTFNNPSTNTEIRDQSGQGLGGNTLNNPSGNTGTQNLGGSGLR